MSTDSPMIIVTALIRPSMEGRVVQALHELTDFQGFYITEARGQGGGRGAGGSFLSTEFDLTYHRYLQVQLVCRTEDCAEVCSRIADAARTGRKGDGVVFSTDAHSFLRIRETKPRLREQSK